MRTTDGASARAAAENADDSTRASLGASVLGVTVPPGVSDGAGGGTGGGRVALDSSGFGDDPRRWQPVATTATSSIDDSGSHRRYLTRRTSDESLRSDLPDIRDRRYLCWR